MKKKRSISIFTGIVAVLAVVIGFAVNGREKAKEIVYMHASWGYNYADVEELARSSDVIGLVKITEVAASYVDTGIPFTEYYAEVLVPVAGYAAGERMTILMTGGETEDKIFVLEDDPLMGSGEEYFIFAQQNDSGTVTVLSGAQGRMVHENGVLNSLNAIDAQVARANTFNNVMVQNLGLEDMLARVAVALEE